MLSNSSEIGSNPVPPAESLSLQTEADETLGFTILQCKSCRSIIGDTSSVLVYNKETSLITLSSTNIIYARIVEFICFRKVEKCHS